MKSKQEMLDFIEGASLDDLIRLWRFEPSGSPYFLPGDVNDRLVEVYTAKREAHSHDQLVAASKRVGWDQP